MIWQTGHISILTKAMEVLFEYRGSRRQLGVSDKENITQVVSGELHRLGRPRAQVYTANDDLPGVGEQSRRSEIYLLQKWSDQWDCYVDVAHYNEVSDGNRLAVIARPKPPSKLWLLCCCGSDSSYQTNKVGGSTKKIPKTEEIQSVEYRFRIDLETGSELGESARSEADIEEPGFNRCKESEQFIRAESGRAAWKLSKSDSSGGKDSAIEIDDSEEETEQANECKIDEAKEGIENVNVETINKGSASSDDAGRNVNVAPSSAANSDRQKEAELDLGKGHDDDTSNAEPLASEEEKQPSLPQATDDVD